MRWTFLLVANLFAFNAMSQMKTIQGQITDEYEKGIPFAVVQVKGQNKGAYSDENGKFALRVNSDSVKELIFYCVGYKSKEIDVKDIPQDNINVRLMQDNIKLDEVTIKWKKEKIREAILGKKNISNKLSDGFSRGEVNGRYGDEAAIFLKTDSARHGILKDVFVFVTNSGIPTTKFRIHVYDEDSATWMPLHDITDSNVIVHADYGNEWVKVDLSKKRIPVNEGVFISVEWVSGYGNDNVTWSNSPVNRANGQVIGFTEGYWKRGFISVYRSSFNKQWYLMPYPHVKKNVLNLEIYGTYTHAKK